MADSRKSNDSNGSLKITSYNIRGLKGKHQDIEFIKYLGNFDIFILLETHALPDAPAIEDFMDQQPDFEVLHWKDATKEFDAGRAIGGCLVGIRHSLKELGITHRVGEANGLKVLQLRMGKKELNVVPLYIRTKDWKYEFKLVEKAFANSTICPGNVIVMGDLNCRIGEFKQEVEPNLCVANRNGRRASDKKRCPHGSVFISFCDANQLQILNGLTHGDPKGRFTSISATIDLAAVSRSLMPWVVDFKVDTPHEDLTRHGSDHLPICLEVDLNFLRGSGARSRVSSPGQPSHSTVVPFDTSIPWTEPTLDSPIKTEEVIFVLRHRSGRKFPRRRLNNVVDVIAFNCNDLLNEPDENKTIISNMFFLLSDTTRIVLNIVIRRLTKWCRKNRLLSDCQFSFSGKYSKIDFVYSLSTIANIKLAKKGTKVYSYFVQFASVLPMLNERLWFKLKKMGVPSKIINFLRVTCKRDEYRNELLNYFRTGKGVLSKLMFSLYLYDLPEELEGGPGLVVDNRRVGILMYADRIAILAGSSNALQDMINQLEEYCDKWGLLVDMGKSEVMVFRRGGSISAFENWMITGKKIKTTSEAVFFNFVFTTALSNKKQVLKMIADAKSRLEDFSIKREPWISLMELHMVQVWGSGDFKEIDKLQEFYLKKTKNTSMINLNILAFDLQLKYIGNLYWCRNESSLARFLTIKVMETNVLWAEQLNTLCEPFGLKWKSCLISEPKWTDFDFAQPFRKTLSHHV